MKTDERIEEIREFLQNHDKQIGFGNLVSNNKIEYYLNITDNDLRKLSPEECAEAANILIRQSLFIQNQINKETGVAKWCQLSINWLIADKIAGCLSCDDKYTPYKYRKIIAIKRNETATQLSQILINIKLKIENMRFIQSKLEKVSERFERLSYFRKDKQ